MSDEVRKAVGVTALSHSLPRAFLMRLLDLANSTDEPERLVGVHRFAYLDQNDGKRHHDFALVGQVAGMPEPRWNWVFYPYLSVRDRQTGAVGSDPFAVLDGTKPLPTIPSGGSSGD